MCTSKHHLGIVQKLAQKIKLVEDIVKFVGFHKVLLFQCTIPQVTAPSPSLLPPKKEKEVQNLVYVHSINNQQKSQSVTSSVTGNCWQYRKIRSGFYMILAPLQPISTEEAMMQFSIQHQGFFFQVSFKMHVTEYRFTHTNDQVGS